MECPAILEADGGGATVRYSCEIGVAPAPGTILGRLALYGPTKPRTKGTRAMEARAALTDVLLHAQQMVERSTWPPDIFAALFDILDVDTIWQSVQDQFIDAERDALRASPEESQFRRAVLRRTTLVGSWTVTDEFLRRARVAIDAACRWNEATASDPDALPDGKGFPLQIAYLARAIDTEAEPLSLYASALTPSRFQDALDVLAIRRTFSKQARGRVIPAAARSGFGNSPRKFFQNLLRIPDGKDWSVDYRAPPSVFHKPPQTPLTIGFIPAVQHQDEVVWGVHRRCFTVKLAKKHEKRVIARVLEGLDWLLRQKADVIIIPELVSSAALRKEVSAWLLEKAPSQPIMVVCGSEAVASKSVTGFTNRAFILGPSGRMLWTQDKHHQYRLTAKDIQRLGLTASLGRDARNEVGTSTHRSVTICDIPGAGRFCVLVCEDLARDDPGQVTLRLFEADMVIVIVMDGTFLESSWRNRNGLNLAQDPGTRIAIGNSRALLARMGTSRPPGSKGYKLEEVAYYRLPNQRVKRPKRRPGGALAAAAALLIAPGAKL